MSLYGLLFLIPVVSATIRVCHDTCYCDDTGATIECEPEIWICTHGCVCEPNGKLIGCEPQDQRYLPLKKKRHSIYTCGKYGECICAEAGEVLKCDYLSLLTTVKRRRFSVEFCGEDEKCMCDESGNVLMCSSDLEQIALPVKKKKRFSVDVCDEDEECLCDESGKMVMCRSVPSPVKKKRRRFSGRIVGGTDVGILKHPYMLGLENNGRLYCGATIIASRWAATAGHCVTVALLANLKLRALTDKLETGGYTFQISEYIPHPDYNDDTQENDIALLRVDMPFSQIDSRLTPINLPKPNAELPVGTMVTVVGWGHTKEFGEKSENLKHVKLPITSYEHCNSRFNGEINKAVMICAGPKEGGRDACQADSGGPLVFDNTLYGIVSFGKGCGMTDVPGVYTKVSAMREWIDQMIAM